MPIKSKPYTPYIACPLCGSTHTSYLQPQNYFNSKLTCPDCNQEYSWWDACLKTLKMDGRGLFSQNIALLLGGRTILVEIDEITLNTSIEVNLPVHGVPKDSTIIFINLTQQNNAPIRPQILYGQDPFPPKIPHKFFIRGMFFPHGHAIILSEELEPAELAIMVTYIPHSEHDHNSKILGKACSDYISQNYDDMIISAYIALEDSAMRLANSFFKKHQLGTEKQKRENLFYQTIPLILDTLRLPRVPDDLNELARKLSGLRDMLAHKGKIEQGTLNHDSASERLCAAIFISNYLTAAEERV
jgi:hypothetical protein